jgi:TldD protein
MDNKFIFDKYGLTHADIEGYLTAALSAGGDFADLYFEYSAGTSLVLDDSTVKSAYHAISAGCGVHVVSGEHTGYAYTDDLAPEKILQAARTAARIGRGAAKFPMVNFKESLRHDYYSLDASLADAPLAEKLDLVIRADKAARAYDSRIREICVSCADELKRILVISSDGSFVADEQPLSQLSIFATARDGILSSCGNAGCGGRHGLDAFQGKKAPEYFAIDAARQAIVQLDARECPVGEMEIVLGPGQPGILLHEAIGHGIEADCSRKKTSVFTGLLGTRVASDNCTVVDNGTVPGGWGSLNVDDEGHPTGNTVLIERGILKACISDKLSARLMGMPISGNGRRQSYRHSPMPRMTNTYMLAGQDSPEDILRSVKHGLYAVDFGGGQVDITNGEFVFSAIEAYMIENGKITAPVKNATLFGNGLDVLTRVSMVGSDLQLDEGVNICSKNGQSIPVGVGTPTLKVDCMTVCGTKTE